MALGQLLPGMRTGSTSPGRFVNAVMGTGGYKNEFREIRDYRRQEETLHFSKGLT